MIAPFIQAAGSAGGIVPGTLPAAAPPPVVDGFDALLGQITAALLATVAEAGAGGGVSTHGPNSSDQNQADHPAEPAAGEPAAWPLAVPIGTLPLAELPQAPTSPSNGDAGPDQPAADVMSTAVAPTLHVGRSGAPGEYAHDTATASDVGAPGGADPHAPSPALVAPAVELESLHVPVLTAPSTFGRQTSAVAVETPPDRTTGPLPFEQVPHERPIGRRGGDVHRGETLAVTTTPGPSSTSVIAEPRPSQDQSAPSPVEEAAINAEAEVAQVAVPTEPLLTSLTPEPRLRRLRSLGSYEQIASSGRPTRNAFAPPKSPGGATQVSEASPAAVGPVATAGAVAGQIEASGVVVADPIAQGQSAPATTAASTVAAARAVAAGTERTPALARVSDVVAPTSVPAVPATPTPAGGLATADITTRRPARLPAIAAAVSAAVTAPAAAALEGAPVFDQPPSLPSATAHAWRTALAAIDPAGLAPTLAAGPSTWASPVGPLALLAGPRLDDQPTTPGVAVVEAPALDAATGDSVQSQIVRSLKLQWAGGLGEARVTLKPEFLGEVVAVITVDRGVVSATLQADSPDVRRWMEAHTASLRDALVEHGLKLDRLTIAEPTREQADAERQGRPRGRQQEAPPQRPRRRAPEGETREFEMTP